jgi:uncharacterized protein
VKLLVLLVVLGLVGWLLFGHRRRAPGARRRAGKTGPESMVACAHCGLHLPRTEALLDGGRPYCSEAHRLAGPH